MFIKNICIEYSLLLIASIGKKSFTELGKIIQKSSDTIRRLLNPPTKNFALLHTIAAKIFSKRKALVLSIDDTLLRKIYSSVMEGSCKFFDTKMGRTITAYKALIAGLTDGKYFIPIHSAFLYSKEVVPNAKELKNALVKSIIQNTINYFSNHIITVSVDGAFATKDLFRWAVENAVRIEARMHSNRKVLYKNQFTKINEIKDLQPKGRHMARTIQVMWHGISLYLTAQRRIDKHGEESIVYQASTYEAKPSEHVDNYKKRWPVEKFNRTGKQHFGLQDCFSTKLEIQESHLSSVLLAYAIVQIEMKKQKFHNSEDTIRSLKNKKWDCLKKRFLSVDEIFGDTHA
jgi:hypothetical protein